MNWDQHITWFQGYQIFQINMATRYWCLRCQSCKRARLKHRSHIRLTNWHVVTMQRVCCKAVLLRERDPFLRVKEKKTWLKKNQPAQNLQQKQSESNGKMTPDLFGGYLGNSKSRPSIKLPKFCGGCDALKVINQRCRTTSLDVVKVHLPITLNESEHLNTNFAIQNLERSM